MRKWSLLAIDAMALCGLLACGSRNQVAPYLYTVGGTLTGLTAAGLVLTNVNGDTVSPAAGATTFTFPNSVALGVAYSVTVTTQPAGQTCAITANGQATVTANVTSIVVTCVDGTVTAVTSKNTPGARVHASAWTDRAGSLWMFGGAAAAATGSSNAGGFRDLWRFDAIRQDWLAISTSGPGPSARAAAATAVGAHGSLLLFGGVAVQAASDSSATLRDFWKFSPDTGAWTLLEAAAPPPARGGAAAWSDASGNFWLFGGSTDGGTAGLLDDFWSYAASTLQWTQVNGTIRPSARQDARYWIDAAGNFWLFGGTTGTTVADELWEFNVTTHTWALVNQAVDDADRLRLSGPALANATSAAGCGTSRQPPAGLTGAATWEGGGGDVWLFGGTVGGAPCATLWHWTPRPQ